VRKNCAGCHGSGVSPYIASPTVATAYPLVLSRVNFAAPASSTIVLRTRDGHCGGSCSTNGAEMIAAITAWTNASVTNAGSAQNISIADRSEIELRVERLMPDAIIAMNGTQYDAFSYQVDAYGPYFGYLNVLTMAATQPGGPRFRFRAPLAPP
jgi:hypothetical protein